MAERSVHVSLGEGDATLSVTFTGTDCEVEDFQMAMVAFAKQWKGDAAKRRRENLGKKPCGCKDKDAEQREDR